MMCEQGSFIKESLYAYFKQLSVYRHLTVENRVLELRSKIVVVSINWPTVGC